MGPGTNWECFLCCVQMWCQHAELKISKFCSVKLCIFFTNSSITENHQLLYYLGPSSHGDRSGIWKCILSYRHVCIYRHILMSWCDWNGFDDLRIMCGPQCCHQCRRGRSLGAFRAQGQEPPGNKIQPCQKGHISKLPTFKTLCP